MVIVGAAQRYPPEASCPLYELREVLETHGINYKLYEDPNKQSEGLPMLIDVCVGRPDVVRARAAIMPFLQ